MYQFIKNISLILLIGITYQVIGSEEKIANEKNESWIDQAREIVNYLPLIIPYYPPSLISEQQKKILNQALFLRSNDINHIESLLRKGADINAVNIRGENVFSKTILRAIDNNNNNLLKVANFLLQNGAIADLNKRDKIGWTLLEWAICRERTVIAKYLISLGADPNLVGKHDELIPLYQAIGQGNEELVKYLIRHGANINGVYPVTSLEYAAYCNKDQIIQLLIEKGAKITREILRNQKIFKIYAEYQNNIVDNCFNAIYDNNIDLVAKFIRNGFNVNAENKHGETGLIRAAEYNHTRIIEYLIHNGANINSVNGLGYTALMWAIMNKNIKLAKLLIEYKIDLNIRDTYGNTALVYLVRNPSEDYEEWIKLLILSGADVNIQNVLGDTALNITSQNNNYDIARLLIEYGDANPYIANNKNCAPINNNEIEKIYNERQETMNTEIYKYLPEVLVSQTMQYLYE